MHLVLVGLNRHTTPLTAFCLHCLIQFQGQFGHFGIAGFNRQFLRYRLPSSFGLFSGIHLQDIYRENGIPVDEPKLINSDHSTHIGQLWGLRKPHARPEASTLRGQVPMEYVGQGIFRDGWRNIAISLIDPRKEDS